jgi:menaquinone-dependent protoporphyrinogen oxidase
VFAGRLERHGLGLTERAMVFAFRAPEGDYRNWDEIGAWAAALADELQD